MDKTRLAKIKSFLTSSEAIYWYIGFIFTSLFFFASFIVDFFHPDRNVSFGISTINSLGEITFSMVFAILFDLFCHDKREFKNHKHFVFIKCLGFFINVLILITFVTFYILESIDHIVLVRISSIVLVLTSFIMGLKAKMDLMEEGES